VRGSSTHVLAALFIVLAAVIATLGSLALARAQDPAVRLAGRFAPALAAGVFLSIRLLGPAAAGWLAAMAGLAACVVTALVLLERNAEHRPSAWGSPIADRLRAQRDRAARALSRLTGV
jgi:uncharacterized membrane protein YfcA